MRQWEGYLLGLWEGLSYDQRYAIWVGVGVVFLALVGGLANRFFRAALGHVRFRGTWYTADQFQVLLLSIQEDVTRGNRVMRHDEMALLRRWRFGSSKGLADGAKGYF